jgi:hypothetical protein
MRREREVCISAAGAIALRIAPCFQTKEAEYAALFRPTNYQQSNPSESNATIIGDPSSKFFQLRFRRVAQTQIAKKSRIVMRLKPSMTGVAKSDQILWIRDSAFIPRPNVVHVKYDVEMVIRTAPANPAPTSIAI